MQSSTQRLTSEELGIISATNYGSANTLANSPVPGRILSRWDCFLQLSGGVCQQTFLQLSSAGVVPLGVEEMTAGGWCIVAPLGTTAAALALKDRFQETSQTFFSLLCCRRPLGQPRSHHISSKCESRPSSFWTPGATSTTLLSDQIRPSSGSSFCWSCWGFKGFSQGKKKCFLPSFVCIHSWLCAAEVEQCVPHWSRMLLWLSSKLFMPKHFIILEGCGFYYRSPTARGTQMSRWMLSDTLVCTLGEGALWQLPELGVFQHQGQATKYRTDLHFHN